MRGVVYQIHPDGVLHDPITDDNLLRLQHDVSLLKELGVNTIFVC